MIFMLQRRQYEGRIYNVLTPLNAAVPPAGDVFRDRGGNADRLRRFDADAHALVMCRHQRSPQPGFERSGSLERGIGDTIDLLTARRSADVQRPARRWFSA